MGALAMEPTQHFDPEQIDLAVLTRALRSAFDAPIEGAIVGRTAVRDAVARELRCSQLQAEQLVDTMIGRGFLARHEAPDGMTVWRFSSPT